MEFISNSCSQVLSLRHNKYVTNTLVVGLSGYAVYRVTNSVANTPYGMLVIQHVNDNLSLWTHSWNSFIISKFSSIEPTIVRDNFRRLNVRQPDTRAGRDNHSHGKAACIRSFADAFIEQVAVSSGLETYSVSMSRRDTAARVAGNRYYYWAKDLQVEYRDDDSHANSLLKLVDVDYYMDMNFMLRKHSHICAYTFNPTKPAGSLANGTYCTISNEVHSNVNGGAKYHHALHYYDVDYAYVRTWYGGKLFLVETKECPVGVLEGKPIYGDNKIVLLTLTATVYGPLGWLYFGHGIGRRQLSWGPFNITRSNEEINGQWEVVKHYSLAGSSVSVSVPERSLESAIIRAMRSKAPAIADIERLFRETNVSDAGHAAALFMTLLTEYPQLLWVHPPIVTKYIGSNFSYQVAGPLVMEEGKPTMRELPITVYPAAYHSKRSYNNEDDTINRRVAAVENKVTRVPPFYTTCMREFIDLLLTPVDTRGYVTNDKPAKWTLVPACLEDVADKQARPTQRALLERAREFLFYGSRTVKAFQKAEPYPKVKSARNISTVSTDAKARLAAFIYPLTELMKKHHFYAFGHHPREFSDVLSEKARKSDFGSETDFEMYDGTRSEFLADFEKALLLAGFPVCYHKEIINLVTAEINAKCFTASGIVYTNGYSRLSGSMGTSVFNTLCNALIAYIAYRVLGNSPLEAYKALGLYGGDDGINFGLPPSVLTRVVEKLGLRIKCAIVTRHQPVTFLARVYLDVWTAPQSFCDVKRQLAKFHLSSTPDFVPIEDLLYRKCEAYVCTDPTTPVISDLCRAILKYLPKPSGKYDDIIRDVSWWSQYESPFATYGYDDARVLAFVCKSFEIDHAEYVNWRTRLSGCKSLTEVLNCKLVEPPEPKVEVTAALGDSLVGLALPKAKEPPAHAPGNAKRVTKQPLYQPKASAQAQKARRPPTNDTKLQPLALKGKGKSVGAKPPAKSNQAAKA